MAASTAFNVGILIVSTTAAKDASKDLSGPLLKDYFAKENEDIVGKHSWNIVETKIVSDDRDAIQSAIKQWTDVQKLHLIITSGGTGFAVSDGTPEVGPELLFLTPELS